MATRKGRATKNTRTEPASEVAAQQEQPVKPGREEAPTTVVKARNASTVEKPVKRVWEISDSMPGAQRKEIIAACVAEGIAFYTARTQYQKWKQSQAI